MSLEKMCVLFCTKNHLNVAQCVDLYYEVSSLMFSLYDSVAASDHIKQFLIDNTEYVGLSDEALTQWIEAL